MRVSFRLGCLSDIVRPFWRIVACSILFAQSGLQKVKLATLDRQHSNSIFVLQLACKDFWWWWHVKILGSVFFKFQHEKNFTCQRVCVWSVRRHKDFGHGACKIFGALARGSKQFLGSPLRGEGGSLERALQGSAQARGHHQICSVWAWRGAWGL